MMDPRLVGYALQYHGPDLLHSLTIEQQEEPSPAILSYLDRRHHQDPEIKDAEFQRRICTFIGKKADVLFKPLSEEEKKYRRDEEIIDDAFAIMPAMETFMDVPSHLRREHFFKSLKPDDCVTGVVMSVLDKGLRVQLLCVDRGCTRDIDDLDIQAFCPAKELPKLYKDESALDAFQEKDIVRGIVLVVSGELERIIISLHEKAIPNKDTYPRIGLITEEEFPVHYRRKSQIKGMSYGEMLQSILGFNNMGNVKALVSQLGIPEKASFLRYLSRLQIPEKEYAEGLRKWQSQKLAHQSVAQGVEMFKSGKYLEAMQYFNRALQIDHQNVDALVARGALYANKENFHHAIQDFEEAMSLDPKHSNARNYLIETLLTFGKICEDDCRLEEAAVHYSHVLKIDPHHLEAKDMLEGCQRLMILHASGKGKQLLKRKLSEDFDSKDMGKGEDSSVFSKTAHKLRQLINEEKQEEPSSRRRKSSLSEKPSRKRKRSSSSSSSSSNTSSSSSSSSRERRKKYTGSRKSHSESTDYSSSQDSTKKSKKRRSRSSRKERKRRNIEQGGRKRSVGEKEERKDVIDVSRSNRKLVEGSLVQAVESSSTMSLLPVSSLEYFRESVAIPGLDSPPASSTAAKGSKAGQPTENPLFGRNAERPEENLKAQRRDDFLMAERERFYRGNKDRYKRYQHSRESSSSSSSPSSRSSSYSKPAYKRHRSSDRRRSWSQSRRSPMVTGNKELDMYLGGAKKLLNNVNSKNKKSTWEYFSDLFTRKSDSKDRRSYSRERRSRSQELSKVKYLNAQTGKDVSKEYHEYKRSVIPERDQRSRWEDDKFGNTSRRDSLEKEYQVKHERGYSRHGDRGREFSNSGLKSYDGYEERVEKENSENWKLKHYDGRRDTLLDTKSSFLKSQNERARRYSGGKIRETSLEESRVHRKDYRNDRRNSFQDLQLHKNSERRVGEINPSIQKERPEVENVQKKNDENHQDEYLTCKIENIKQLQKQYQDPSEESFLEASSKKNVIKPKNSGRAFILRMPKMDDPTLNTPLMSSNELAAIERKKKQQQEEKTETHRREETTSGLKAGSLNRVSDSGNVHEKGFSKSSTIEKRGQRSTSKSRSRSKSNDSRSKSIRSRSSGRKRRHKSSRRPYKSKSRDSRTTSKGRRTKSSGRRSKGKNKNRQSRSKGRENRSTSKGRRSSSKSRSRSKSSGRDSRSKSRSRSKSSGRDSRSKSNDRQSKSKDRESRSTIKDRRSKINGRTGRSTTKSRSRSINKGSSRSASRGRCRSKSRRQSRSSDLDRSLMKDHDRQTRYESRKTDRDMFERRYDNSRDQRYTEHDKAEFRGRNIFKRQHILKGEQHYFNQTPRINDKRLKRDEIEREIERRVQERLKEEEDKLKTEVKPFKKSRWDVSSIRDKEDDETEKVDNKDKVAPYKEKDVDKTDNTKGYLGNRLAQEDLVLKKETSVGDRESADGDNKRPSPSPDLTSDLMLLPSDLAHSKWDTDDTVGVSKKTEYDCHDEKKDEGEKTLKVESLTELEKFLIDLKQQKKKQWIAEGKLKEKN